MKKLILVIVLILSIFLMSSCGNRTVGIDVYQTFTKAYVNIKGEWKEFAVSSWRDFEDSDVVQIVTTDGNVYLTHYMNMVLVK